jgi:hypothetical protein
MLLSRLVDDPQLLLTNACQLVPKVPIRFEGFNDAMQCMTFFQGDMPQARSGEFVRDVVAVTGTPAQGATKSARHSCLPTDFLSDGPTIRFS